MSQVHILCTRSELILLCRLEFKSHFSDCFLTILTEIELILRRSRAAMLEAQSCAEDPGSWICRDPARSFIFRGVCSFSKSAFGGDITMSNIGSKNKKDS